MFKQLQLLQAHEKDTHKDVKYTCRFCDRTFQTYGGKRKHEVLHLPPRHFCEYCQKGFHFNNELVEHHRYHTKENLGGMPGMSQNIRFQAILKGAFEKACRQRQALPVHVMYPELFLKSKPTCTCKRST